MGFWDRLFGRTTEPPRTIVDPDGQVRALLTNTAFLYASRMLGVDTMLGHSYRDVFTVSRTEVEAYIARHDIRVEDYAERYHWVRMYPRNDEWIVAQFYPPEKGPGYEVETTFHTESQARRDVLDKLLSNTQTGIFL